MAKVKVTVTSNTKQAYNLAILWARTLKRSRDVSSDQKMILSTKVMVKVTMTFTTTFLLSSSAVLYDSSERHRAIMALLFVSIWGFYLDLRNKLSLNLLTQ